jgi:hypothetical protein
MPPTQFGPAAHSQIKLADALETLENIQAKHKRWMTFAPSTSGHGSVLHPHPVYSVRLNRFLEGKPLSATLKKVGWIYFLRDSGRKLACAEVSVVSGKHKNARLSEGPFVKKAFNLIERLKGDSRLRRRPYELRFLRLESIHLFALWLKVDQRVEYFVPVTSTGAVLRAGEWISRKDFTKALRSEGERIRAAQERMSHLLRIRQG